MTLAPKKKRAKDPLLDSDLSAPFFDLPETEFSLETNQSYFKRLMVFFVFAAPSFFFLALVAFFIFSLNSPQKTPATYLFGACLLSTVGFAFLARYLLKSLFRTFELSQHYLQHSEEQFRLLANSIPDLVSVAKVDGTGLWYNDAWYRYTGSSPQDSEGINWKHVHHPDYFPKVFLAWKNAVESGKAFEIQFPLKGKDGQYRRFLYRATPLKNKNGNIFLWFGTCTDIEEEMIKRDDFLSIASHELKTPITSLNLQIQLLEKALKTTSSPLPDFFHQAIPLCRLQMEKMIALINTLLDLTQIQLGTLKLNRSPMDLSFMAEEICNRFRLETEAKKISLTFEKKGSCFGKWDSTRLEQVLTNLLSNAVKYGKGKPVRVLVEAFPTKEKTMLVVEDDGDGIAPEVRERIFQRFSRAKSESHLQGLGLGLYICQQLVTAHGGTISVEPVAHERGARFIVTLPNG